jgi:hypothetical protein
MHVLAVTAGGDFRVAGYGQGTLSHCMDATSQYIGHCSATGIFMVPSDQQTWIGAVLMGGWKSDPIINCDGQC